MNILKIKNDIFKILIELFILDKTFRMKIKSRWAKKCLQKYVVKAIEIIEQDSDSEQENITQKDNNIIWQYWHQGEENAPLLIRKCLESVERYHPEQKRVVLSYESISDYVEIPAMYYDLVNQGKMSLTFFSDVLRTYLLTQYNGGTWVDSTIFLTDKIPDDIMNAKFFVFGKDPKTDRLENKMSSFFIHTRGYSPTINALQKVFMQYWKENDFLINYFLIEHLSSMLSDANQKFIEEWSQKPYYSAEDTGLMQKIIFNDFNQDELDRIKSKTNLHKLSYKILRDQTSGNSYYDKIINGEIV